MNTIYTIQSHLFLEQVMYSYKNYCILIISNKRLEKCCALRKIIYTKKNNSTPRKNIVRP